MGIFGVGFKEGVFDTNKRFAGMIMLVIRFLILTILYANAFRQKEVVGGLNFVEVIWSMGLYFVLLLGVGVREIAKEISLDIERGKVEVSLIKPVSYLMQKFVYRLGKSSFELVTVSGSIFLFIGGGIGFPQVEVSAVYVFQVLLIFVLAIGLGGAIYALIGISAFWIEKSDPIFWVVDKLIMTLGGAYLPVAMFPDAVRWIAENFPFGASMFLTQVVYPDFSERAWYLIGVQFGWFLVALVFLKYSFGRAQRKIVINGG